MSNLYKSLAVFGRSKAGMQGVSGVDGSSKVPSRTKLFFNSILMMALFVWGTVSNAQAQSLNVTLEITDTIECYGGLGELTFNVSGGVNPYTYQWSDQSSPSAYTSGSNVRGGLTAGTYTVSLTDGVGATGSATINLFEPALLTFTSSSFTSVTCNGAADGTVTVVTQGGTAPYTYSWSGPTSIGNVATASGLAPGTYTVTLTDANGCGPVVTSLSFSEPTALSATATASPSTVSCYGDSTGGASVSVTGGTAPYTYAWSSGETTSSISSLAAGSYTVTVTDANSCTATSTTSVTGPLAPVTHTATADDVSCKGDANGSITLSPSGGNGSYTYVWSHSTSVTTASISNLSPGTYAYTISDVNGCSVDSSITITEPSMALTMTSSSVTNVLCYAATTGAIDVTIAGGTTPYTYSWSNASSSEDLSSVAAGNYSLTVTDSLFCTYSASFTITEPASAISVSETVTDVNCYGGNDGAVSVTVTGGTSPYSYAWSNNGTASSISGLTAGTYTLTVTDAVGCVDSSASYTVSQPTAPLQIDASSGVTSISCNGLTDGSIDVTISGGTSPYTYAWSNSATTQDISSLSAGTYSMTVTDDAGCSTNVQSLTISEPSLLSVTGSSTNLTCNESADGSATVSVTGGTTPYTYTWSNGGTSTSISNLSAGTYSVSVSDANLCTGSYSYTITEPAAFSLSVTSSDITCNGAADGQIVAYVTSTGSSTFAISDGTTNFTALSSGTSGSVTFTASAAGFYTITATDEVNTTCTESSTVIINEPDTFAVTATADSVSCNGESDGSVAFTVTGGTAPYTYSWSDGASFSSTSRNITNLPAGSYSVTVTDANSCTGEYGPYSVGEPDAIALTMADSNITCFGADDGWLTVSVTGGTSPYSYAWSNSATTDTISGLGVGSYRVTVTDANGCTDTISGSISEPTLLVVTLDDDNTNDVSCQGAADGQIAITAVGGRFFTTNPPGTPYQYTWEGPNGPITNNSQTLSGLSGGVYSVTVTDASGCTGVVTHALAEPTFWNVAYTTDSVSCYGESDGAINFTYISNNTPPYVFTDGAGYSNTITASAYSLGLTFSNVPIALNLPETNVANANVQALITESGGFLGTIASDARWFTYDTLGISYVGVTFVNDTNIAVWASSGGYYNFFAAGILGTFSSPEGDGSWGVNNGAFTIDALAAGSYTYTVSSSGGCDTSFTVVIGEPAQIVVTDSIVNSCYSLNNGEIHLSTAGGNGGPYTYTWANSATTSSLSNLSPGSYSVTVSDGDCSVTDTYNVTQPAGPTVISSHTVISHVSVYDGTDGSFSVSVTGYAAPYEVVILNVTDSLHRDTAAIANISGEHTFSGLNAGDYEVVVTDNNGCENLYSTIPTVPSGPSTTVYTITIYEPLDVVADSNNVCYGSTNGSIDLIINGGAAPYSVTWSDGGSSSAAAAGDTVNYGGLAVGSYSFTVTESSGLSFTYSDTISVAGPNDPIEVANFINVDAACYGGSDGYILTQGTTGGFPPYSYAWSNGSTTKDLYNLTAGLYDITITDASGCERVYLNITVDEPDSIVFDGTALTSVTCYGGNDGAIDLVVAGGTQPYTYEWINLADGSVVANTQDLFNLTAGTYVINLTDDHLCTQTDTFEILEPADLVVTVAGGTDSILTCFGDTDGNIDVFVNGGIGAYAYAWSNGETTQDIAGLAAGVYTLTVTDDNMCTETVTVEVHQPDSALAVVAVQDSVTCYEGADGSFTLSFAGGWGGYTYATSAGAGTPTIVGDGTCSDLIMSEYVEGSGNNKAIEIYNASSTSKNLANYKLHRYSNGSTTPYVISLSGTVLPGATYVIAHSSADVALKNLADALNSQVNFTGNDAVALYSVSLGVNIDVFGVIGTDPGSEWTLTNGGTTKDHTVRRNADIQQGDIDWATAELGWTATSQNDFSDIGSHTMTPCASNSYVAGAVVSNLATGTYTYTVTDAEGCEIIGSVDVLEPAPISATLTLVQDVQCYGESNGAVNVSAIGGSGTLQYAWDNGETTANASMLNYGTHVLTITDTYGCDTTYSIFIDQPDTLQMLASSTTDVICKGDANGTVTVSYTGGTPFYSITMNGTTYSNIPDGTSVTFSGLVAGTYTTVVSDDNGCSAGDSFTINEPAAPLAVASTTQDSVSCFGLADGSATVSITGGWAGYTYAWDANAGSQSTATATGLSAGTYGVTVTDANGCQVNASVTVLEPADLVLTIDSISPVVCENDMNGVIYYTYDGGTAGYTATLSQDLPGGGSYSNTASASGLDFDPVVVSHDITFSSGSLQTAELDLTGSSSSNCGPGFSFDDYYNYDIYVDNQLILIGVCPSDGPFDLSIYWPFSNVTVESYDADGWYLGDAVTVVADLTVISVPGQNTVSSTSLSAAGSASFTGLGAGTYTVQLVDNNGCTVSSAPIDLANPDMLDGVMAGDLTGCPGANNGYANVTVTGGVAPYNVVWVLPNGVTVGVAPNGSGVSQLNNLTAGTYTVSITDDNGCVITRDITLDDPTEPVLSEVSVVDVDCNGNSTGSITIGLADVDQTAPYYLYWYNSAGSLVDQDTVPATGNYTYSGFAAGTYTLLVEDLYGCDDTLSYVVTEPAVLSASASGTDVVDCFGDATGTATVAVTGGTAPYSYAWSNGATTASITGLVSGTYTVTVTDDQGCTDASSYTVDEPAQLIVASAVIKDNDFCAQAGNGTITLTVGGGTAPFNLAWNTGYTSSTSTTDSLTNLIAGIYTVTITDANGCSIVEDYNVLDGVDPILINVTTNDPLCNGDANGSFDVVVTGGTAPYYMILQAETSNNVFVNVDTIFNVQPTVTYTFPGYADGDYRVKLVDVNGCLAYQAASLVENDVVVASASATAASCNMGADGTAMASAVGGTGTYTYAWSNGATDASISGLAAGTYTVTVSDANGCSDAVSVTVTEPTGISLTGAVTDLTCNGDLSGAINITVNGGTPGYAYAWSNGSTTEDLSNIAAGIYTVTVTDANLCTVVSGFSVTEPAVLTIASAVITDVTCNGLSDGAVNITVTGGTAPYTFNWTDATGATVSTSEDLTGVVAGTYTGNVTDVNGCTTSATVTITEPVTLTANASSTDVMGCYGGFNGTAMVVAAGGTTPYTYAWSNGATDANLSLLFAGSYDVTVTDANGCTVVDNVVISQPAPIAVATVVNDISCFGANDGSIVLTPSGGVGNFTYDWSTGATTSTISNLTPGSYSVVIDDGNGCDTTYNFTVIEPAELIATVASTSDVLCNGGSTASISIDVTGGTGNYTYSWSNGAATEDLANIPAGTYTLTVTDDSGCTDVISATVNEPAVLTVGVDNVVNNLCFGDMTGVVDISAAGGVTPYSYAWSNGQTSEDASGLGQGSYTVTVTDANGCTVTLTQAVTHPDDIVFTNSAISNVSCNGLADGTADFSVIGGVGNYTFLWSNGAATQNLTGLAAGTYTGTVTDDNGCTETVSVTITEPAVLAVSATVNDISCYDAGDGSVVLVATGGTAPYSYAWADGSSTSTISGLIPGTYNVTITDANGCQVTGSYAVTQPAAPISVASLIVTDVYGCYGDQTGSIQLTAIGGTPGNGYSYLWSNGATTKDIYNLSAGGYQVTITDANGCTHTVGTLVEQPDLLVANINNVVDVTCTGGSDGSLTLSVIGGTTAQAPYMYMWNTGATTANLSNLSAGLYTVTVTDANGCTAIDSVTIVEPAVLAVAIDNVTDVACFGTSTGAVDATITGGTMPYTVSWSGGLTATTADLNGVPSGTYIMTVTDACGTQVNTTVTIDEPLNGVSASIATTAVDCYGAANGVADLSVSGGTPPYSFLWSNGAVTEDLNATSAGTYTVVVTDANGCTTSATATVGQPAAPIALATSVTDAACQGDANGMVDLTITGGTTPYTVVWSDGQSTEDASGLAAGTYTVTVTDANGCTSTVSAVVNEPAVALAITNAVATDASCNGAADGSVDITVAGGVAPYTYAWNNNDVTQDINGVAAGTYSVVVTDANGCSVSTSVVVNEPAVLAASAVVTDVACFGGSNGSIDVTVTGGTAPYSFSWSNGAQTEDLSGVAAGTYTGVITDANGCSTSATLVVAQPSAPLSSTGVVSNILCNGAATGSIDLTVSGGSAPYTFAWSNGTTSEDASGLAAGPVTVTVTDANGCTQVSNFSVSQPSSAIAVVNAAVSNVSCNGGSDGAVDITVAGGVAPYTFAWSNGTSTEDLSGLVAGTYTGTITDANGCTFVASVTVTQPISALAVSGAVVTDLSCFGSNDGAIDITVTGGTTPYTFSWSNNAITEDISNLAAGIYTGVVTDANGCSVTASVTVSQPTAITTSVNVTDIACNGSATGVVDLTVGGGSGTYTYVWSNGASSQDLNGVAAGTYTVTVTDGNGCTSVVTSVVNQSAALNLNVSSTDVNCFGGTSGSAVVAVGGGNAPYTYSWSNGSTNSGANGLAAGTYTVDVTDASGCTAQATVVITEPAELTVSAQSVQNSGQATAVVTGGSPQYTYLWNSTPPQFTQTAINLPSGIFQVQVTDANGCVATDTVSVVNVGLNNEIFANSISMYPNPTSNILNVSFEFSNTVDMTTEIYNAVGQVVYSNTMSNVTSTNLTVDVTDLSDGVYFVVFNDGNRTETRRLVIQK